MKELYEEFGRGINPYGLDYPVCLDDPHPMYSLSAAPNSKKDAVPFFSSQASQLLKHSIPANTLDDTDFEKNPPWLPTQDSFRPCAEEHLETYLNRPDVMSALHAQLKRGPWTACSDKIHYSQEDALTPQMKLYKELVEMLKDHSIHILVYSGDDDSVCSLEGTQTW
jgi:hypothetical protein